MAEREKKKKCPPEGAADWLLTYGDMTTLLLTFFVTMISSAEIDGYELQLIFSSFNGLGPMTGGNTLDVGKLAELGNTINTLPSLERGTGLNEDRQEAVSLFAPEIQSEQIRVTVDERGLVISLASDAFFPPASAEIDIESARSVLQRLAVLLGSEAVAGRYFRIEGHTDSIPTDPFGEWETNWELSTDRATNTLHYLVDFGADEDLFQVSGFADTRPLMSNDTEEGRAYNRRVDIIILAEGHL